MASKETMSDLDFTNVVETINISDVGGKNLSQCVANSPILVVKNFLSAEHLANNIQEAPVWVMAILRNAAESTNPRTGSSIYGAVQHLMLAARAHGIGATLTTLYASHEKDVKQLLGIPEDAMTMALIPLGYPSKGRWAEPKRQPVKDIAFKDHWGQPIL